MNELGSIWRRWQGHVLIVGIALIVLLVWRFWLQPAIATISDEGDGMVDTAVAQPSDLEPEATADPLLFSTEELPVRDDSSLIPAPIPRTFEGKLPQHQFVTHTVVRGETPNGIAEQYGIEPETILGGNPRLSEESSLLQVGTELIILPIDGVLHDVQPGDTLESVSLQYGISVDDIIAYGPNNLEFPYRLQPETQILVPGAVRELFVWTPPDLSSVGGTSIEGGNVVPVIVGTGTFVYPVNARNYTQFFWYGHPGLDIALPEGSPVYASDTGTVTFAGWNVYGYGNLIVINHGNGYETFYAHLSSFNVVPGQIVYQGNIIGGSGNTGNSSGPHIHFEIRLNNNRDNPCWYIGC
ncbi:peptidoglycan DD-metalloendopeptidase family protein [Candidatus Leptofilum sp.]|uniref:peptidoglycan DD-metalloendopeptidase family protein n=1 Tax=Candidatus Leptofilum sp. TaxID=3241576 RepID=UPI003B5992C5